MKKMKRATANTVVSILLISTLLAGCTTSPSASKEESASTETKQVSDKKMKISWLGRNQLPNTIMEKNTEAQKLLETKFNVEIEPVIIDTTGWQQQITALFASGQVPDIIWASNVAEMVTYANQGVLAEIPLDMIKQHAPNYYKDVMEIDPKVLNLSQYKGKNYAMIKVDPIATVKRMSGVRQSWYDKVGIKKEPETLQEFEDMFVKFRENDPDGNGKKDTYAFSIMWKPGSANFGGASNDIVSQFFYAFGTMPSMRFIKDGKVIDGSVQPEVKDGLKLLKRWYDMELIDPEFVVDDSNTWHNKFINGRVGFYGRTVWWVNPTGLATNALKEKAPNDGIKILKPPVGPKGSAGIVQDNPAGSGMVVFGKQLEKDPAKLQKILQIIDAAGGDPAVTFPLGRVGIEGKHWKFDQAGALQPIPPYDKAEVLAKEGKTEFFTPWLSKAYQFAVLPKGVDKILKDYGIGPFDPIYKYPLPSSKQYQNNVWTVVDEWMANFIIGKKDIDKDWDAYLDAWKKAGGDVLEKEADEVYQTMFKK
jgi:putative aldouronate transport system substrate-binding protein